MKQLFSVATLVAAGLLSTFTITPARAADAPNPPAATQPAEGGVPVRAVVLFSSGVGYFEHFGVVNGNASTELRFKTSQINDILKSLVLQDLDGGKVSTITYPSQDPIDKTLRSFQVDITGNPSLADLLNQLRGAKVTISITTGQIKGTILGVEKKPREVGEAGDKKVVETPVLNVIASGMIRTIPLDDVRGIQLDDPDLQAELNKALEALASARDQDKKPVNINFNGDGERHVRLGYVVETPIWKTSYRLILAEKPSLQGWAIVENQTDNDWKDVQLSLVSGRPISFIQDLYQPLYIPRPIVQPELYASLTPQEYDAGMDKEKDMMDRNEEAEGRRKGDGKALGDVAGKREMQNAQARGVAPAPGAALYEQLASKPMDATASVSSIASASKVGELFQYTVGNVSLPRQKSAMIPIITDAIEVERLSIYNVNVLAKNPLNGARVKNITDKHLLAGPITVFDDNTYAGDARIDNVPPGQERLLSYGIDLQMLVNSTNATQTNAVQTGKIVKGVLQLTRKYVFQQEYVAENKADKDKSLIVEHTFHPGWKLIAPEKPLETTDTLYRFKIGVAKGKTEKLTVHEELVQGEAIGILPGDIGQLSVYARTGEIPQTVRDALTEAISRKQAMVDTQRVIQEKQNRIAIIRNEQNPIRENIKAINDKNSPLYERYLKKFDEQETEIDKLDGEIKELTAKYEDQRKALETYLNEMNVE